MKSRATVMLNARDLDYDREGEDPQYMSEWVHEEDLAVEDNWVTLSWPEDEGGAVRIPLTSVLRIDIEPCRCASCKQAVREFVA